MSPWFGNRIERPANTFTARIFLILLSTRGHVSTQPNLPDSLYWFHLTPRHPVEQVRYSEKFRWEKGSFDPIVHALAQYYKVKPRWGFISAFSGGVDGRHALTHSSLVRHYMDHCGTWKSSVRLILGACPRRSTSSLFLIRAR